MDDFEGKLPDRAATLHGVGAEGERDAATEANVGENPIPTRPPLATKIGHLPPYPCSRSAGRGSVPGCGLLINPSL